MKAGGRCMWTKPSIERATIGVTLEGPNNVIIEQLVNFDWKSSNNQEECKALIAGLKLAIEVGVKKLRCMSNSKLITEKVNKVFQARETCKSTTIWSSNSWSISSKWSTSTGNRTTELML